MKNGSVATGLNGRVGGDVTDGLQRDVSCVVVGDGIVDCQAAGGLNKNAVSGIVASGIGDRDTGEPVECTDFQPGCSIVADQNIS